ncbi:hypothetical protein IMCC3317_26260 [Kordia antarctica]|uniref:Lipoprotein n=1 Tax=Kordia antarctica TaxID=1218801 RepID=A0A7L4ZKL0_9FLAO|nr:hypothetical protein [Kordia antarctica]QHI37248.1 hypothetical protein IMCC3317_26260 [Kordia antarctica]
MYKRSKFIALLLLFCLLNSCGKLAESQETDHFHAQKLTSENYINVRFIQSGTTYPIRMNCIVSDIEESKNEIFFKKITDGKFIQQFVNTYQAFELSTENHSTDFRITAFVHQKDKKTDTLCFGEDYGTYVNGIKMDDNTPLLPALKQRIHYKTTFRTKEEILNED